MDSLFFVVQSIAVISSRGMASIANPHHPGPKIHRILRRRVAAVITANIVNLPRVATATGATVATIRPAEPTTPKLRVKEAMVKIATAAETLDQVEAAITALATIRVVAEVAAEEAAAVAITEVGAEEDMEEVKILTIIT